VSAKHLYTSYFALYGSHPRAVAITGVKPSWLPNVAHYPELAPPWSIVSAYKQGRMTQEEFTQLYLQTIVRKNGSPSVVLAELEEGSILLCYEKSGQFCHRHIAAEWLRIAGADVQELTKRI